MTEDISNKVPVPANSYYLLPDKPAIVRYTILVLGLVAVFVLAFFIAFRNGVRDSMAIRSSIPTFQIHPITPQEASKE